MSSQDDDRTARQPSDGDSEPRASASPEASSSIDLKTANAASSGGPTALSRFAITAQSDTLVLVRKRIVSVHVDKPNRTSWWIVHPGYQLTAGIFADKGAGREEKYLVAPELTADLGDDVSLMRLHGAMTREGVFFIIPVRLPSPDGRVDEWTASRTRAVELAMQEPVRMASNVSAGAYEVFTTPSKVPFPDWPEESWEDLIEVAFRGKMIESVDHPVLKRLRGEF